MRRPGGSSGARRSVVIGAGIAGLTAACALVEGGRQVVVLDKGRGPGGRAASRRRGDFQFDHGAQYFTARDAAFREQVAVWRDAGVTAPWPARLAVIEGSGIGRPRGERERFVGVPGMSALGRHLARNLDLRSGVAVARLARDGDAWRVEGAEGNTLAVADEVLVTTPPDQAIPLLSAAPDLAARVGQVVMRPCWAVMLGFAAPVGVRFDGAFVNEGPLAWVARNSSKPGRQGGEAWVLHATASWSESHLEDDPAVVTEHLRAEFARLCGNRDLTGIAHQEAHRWRYAQPDPALAESHLHDAALGLGVAGDWCGGPRIEGAFLSGAALARQMLT